MSRWLVQDHFTLSEPIPVVNYIPGHVPGLVVWVVSCLGRGGARFRVSPLCSLYTQRNLSRADRDVAIPGFPPYADDFFRLTLLTNSS
jgi:hypothetical protein